MEAARKSALIIVDVQNDFISGTLAVPGGEQVVQACNQLRKCALFDVVVVSKDWHPAEHISFASNAHKFVMDDQNTVVSEFSTISFAQPPIKDVQVFPVHCVAGTWGASLHEDLEMKTDDIIVLKGMHAERESFSAFADNLQLSDTHLHDTLTRRGVTDLFCCGLAYDICVAWTARDAARRGFRSFVVEDASAGVDEAQSAKMKVELTELGVQFVRTNQVPSLVHGSSA